MAAASVPPSPARATAPDYALTSGDRVRVVVFNEPTLSGEFTVRAAGPISMPLLGTVHAVGLTPKALEDEITNRLRADFLVDPKVTVEIIEYRRLYVLGNVKTPGGYSYQTGMTVLDSVALAGSYAVTEADSIILMMERTRAEKAYAATLGSYRVSLARVARLSAEQDQLNEIQFPEELMRDRNMPEVAQIMRGQQQLFETRRATLAATIDNLERQIPELKSELETLKAQLTLDTKELHQLKTEIANVAALFKRGHVPKSRLTEAQKDANRAETARYGHMREMDKAKQAIIVVRRTILQVQGERRNTIAAELQQERNTVADLRRKLDAADEELDHARARAEIALSSTNARRTGKFLIMRNTGEKITEIEATATTLVRPGDTIIVPMSDGANRYGGEALTNAAEPGSPPPVR